LGEQKETGSEGVLGEHIGPAVFRWFPGCGDNPELAVGMVDDGDGVAEGGCDFPAAAWEVDLVIGVAAAAKMEGEVKIEEAHLRSGTHGIAVIGSGLCPSLVGGEAGGPAYGAVLTFDLPVEDVLGRVVMGNSLEGQQGDEAILKGAEAALDLSFGFLARSD